MIKVREGDPYSSEFRTVIAQWRVNLGTNHAYTVQEVVGRAVNVADFQAALVTVAEAGTVIWSATEDWDGGSNGLRDNYTMESPQKSWGQGRYPRWQLTVK